ncbi:retrovirus-related pol polyprotein from transposon TNT 1-94 [Tanacetum coccineum]
MEDLLYVKDYYLPVFTTEKPENKTDAEWTILHIQDSGYYKPACRTSLSNSAPDGVITMELAKGNILNEETRRKSQGSSSQSDVLVTERRGRSQNRGPSNRVERQTGKKLKCIRTDNGGEYIGPFDAYCREHGIQHQKTPPKTPQLNGLAERMNRTLVERVRCLAFL